MSGKVNALLQYHEAAQRLEQLENRIRSTPQRQRFNQLHTFLTEQQALIKTTQRQLESRKAVVDKLAAHFVELQRQYELEISEFEIMEQDEECTAAEMTESRHAMEKLVDAVTAARRELYDTIAWVEKAITEYKLTNAKASKAKKEYDAIRAACEAEMAEAKPEVDALSKEVARLRQGVDAAILKRYDVIKTHHAIPMAKVENDQCGGCNMSLPTAVVKRVATTDAIVECENCGRILYV